MWVRAVDGVSFDVRRGEVFCLVGESGCGKTSTGKALLRLVEPTTGDIFFEMPDREYDRLASVRKDSKSTANEAEIDELRRKYSLTWKESIPWTWREYLLSAVLLATAFELALLAPLGIAAILADPFANGGFLVGAAVLQGILVGLVGVLPPSRPSRRTPFVSSFLAIVANLILPVFALAFKHTVMVGLAGLDLAGAFGYGWNANAFAVILAVAFAPAIAGGVGRAITGARQQSEGLTGVKMRTLRRRLHLIFQDPYESLNPKQSVFEIVAEPLRANRIVTNPEEIASLVSRSLEDAGLRPAEEFIFRFPHELSGGQRQRVSIAAALAIEPDFIVADEPVSMLDVSIRTEILQLMMDLRKRRGLTYLFITHDLSLAWILADRVSVMYLGKIVESGTAEQVIAHPRHPYTQALISVVPSPDPRHVAKRVILKGERPDAVDIPGGCRFHPRCPVAFERCGWSKREVATTLRELQGEIASQLTRTITDRGVQAKELRSRAGDSGTASPTLASQADALEAEAASLQPALARAMALQGVMHGAGPRSVAIDPPPGMTPSDLAEQLQALVATMRDERLAFRAIADVRVDGGKVVLDLHEGEEPKLIEIAPGNTVACHLVTMPAAGPEPIPAA